MCDGLADVYDYVYLDTMLKEKEKVHWVYLTPVSVPSDPSLPKELREKYVALVEAIHVYEADFKFRYGEAIEKTAHQEALTRVRNELAEIYLTEDELDKEDYCWSNAVSSGLEVNLIVLTKKRHKPPFC